MSEPYIKAVPQGDKLAFIMDRAGCETFRRLIARAKPLPTDSPKNFATIRDRADGAFFAGAIQMGWDEK